MFFLINITIIMSIFVGFSAFAEKNEEVSDYRFGDLSKETIRLLQAEPTSEILAFTSDGCSSFPDSFLGTSWQHCCLTHDITYWQGGPVELRTESDRELNQCVSEVAGPALGSLMQLGVIVGGQQRTRTNVAPWRWGYGWDYIIGYDSLTIEQNQSVNEKTYEMVQTVLRMSEDYTAAAKLYVADRLNFLLQQRYEISGDESPIFDTQDIILEFAAAAAKEEAAEVAADEKVQGGFAD